MHCTHCNSDNILTGLTVSDTYQGTMNFVVQKDRNPDALIFKNTVRYPITAHLCADCKHVMLFAQKEVYEEDEK